MSSNQLTDEITINPCPKCGPMYLPAKAAHYNDFWLYCPHCHLRGPISSPDIEDVHERLTDAIIKWNEIGAKNG